MKIAIESEGRTITVECDRNKTYIEYTLEFIRMLELIYECDFNKQDIRDGIDLGEHPVLGLRDREQQAFEDGFNRAVEQISEDLEDTGWTLDSTGRAYRTSKQHGGSGQEVRANREEFRGEVGLERPMEMADSSNDARDYAVDQQRYEEFFRTSPDGIDTPWSD